MSKTSYNTIIPVGPLTATAEVYTDSGNECNPGNNSLWDRKVAKVPSGELRTYTPENKNSWRSASTDGSWSSVKKSGSIKMTPMSVGETSEQNYIGSASRSSYVGVLCPAGKPYGKVNGKCTKCVSRHIDYYSDVAHVDYIEQGDLVYWKERFPNLPHITLGHDYNWRNVEAQKAAAYQELFQAYNLGEELVEMRSTVKQIGDLIKSAVKVIRDYKRLSTLKDPKAQADAWLTYRYGIMPIVYSIQDLTKLMSSQGNYRTVRKTVRPKYNSKPPLPPSCFYDEGTDGTTIRITAKGRWATSEARISDLVNVNPLTTAATVYPWALVVRWFFNVNSALDTWVKSATTSALEYGACVATRTSKQIDTHLRFTDDQTIRLFYDGHSGSCGPNWFRAFDETYGSVVKQSMLLRSYTENSYRRELFFPSDVQLVWNPVITPSRLIDAISFALGVNNRSLRSI